MPRKRTHDEFVSILADINQDIVVLGHYENANTPVEVECLICGHRWSPRPASLTNIRSCCPVCAVKKRGEKQRKGLSELQTEMMVKGITEIEVAGDVIGYGTKTSFRCRVCGNLWKATPTSILSGRGCPKCSGHHRRSQEEFVSDVLAVNPDVEVIGEFVNRKTPVEVRCKKCGRTWSPKASSLLLGHGCRVCAGNLPLSHEAFIERLSSINPNVEILGKYQSRNKKIKARCRKCGAVWSPMPNNLLNGSTCLRCSYEKRAQEKKKTHEDFLAELSEINPQVRVKGIYSRSNQKIEVECLLCGATWHVVPSSLLAGRKCPYCQSRSTSYMEQFILSALRRTLGAEAVLSRDRSLIGKELDIAIPSLGLAVEPGSWFWHKGKVEEDKNKRVLAAEKGFRLVTIYDCYSSGEVAPEANCWTYDYDLRSEEGHVTLKKVVLKLLETISIQREFSNEEWADIENEAEENSRKRTHEEFVSAVQSLRPDVEILGRYTSTKKKVLARCRKCGYEWEAVPNSLLRGSGCRKCGRRIVADHLRMKPEEYADTLAVINPAIELVGQYEGSDLPVLVKCKVCGHEWSPIAISLTRGKRGCPVCWEARRGKALLKTHEQFLAELSERGNPNVLVVGKYTKSSERIAVSCKKCGHRWYPKAGSLLRGVGCPKCSGRMKKTHSEYVAELATINPSIEPIGVYVKADEKIHVRCRVCGHEWNPSAISLTRTKAGCPKCKQKKSADAQRRTQDQFEAEVKALFPELEVLGEYFNANTKIKMRCKACGCEWNPKPSYLLNALRGCPECSKRQRSGL